MKSAVIPGMEVALRIAEEDSNEQLIHPENAIAHGAGPVGRPDVRRRAGALPGLDAGAWRVAARDVIAGVCRGECVCADAVRVARLRARPAQRVDVSDEVTDDESRVVIRDRIIAIALTWVVEAAALSKPPGDVEVSETDHGNRARGSVDVRERSVRRQERVQDPPVADREPVLAANNAPRRIDCAGRDVPILKHRPVVVAVLAERRADARLVVEKDAEVESRRNVVWLSARVDRDTAPRLRRCP